MPTALNLIAADGNVSHLRHRIFLCTRRPSLFPPPDVPLAIPSVPFHRRDLRPLQLYLKFLASAKNRTLFLPLSSQVPHVSLPGQKEVSHQHRFTHLSLLPQLPPSQLAHPVPLSRPHLPYPLYHPQIIVAPDRDLSCLSPPRLPPSVQLVGVTWSALMH